jgi:hypothetical protein
MGWNEVENGFSWKGAYTNDYRGYSDPIGISFSFPVSYRQLGMSFFYLGGQVNPSFSSDTSHLHGVLKVYTHPEPLN